MFGNRVVRSDKKGLYVISDRKKWRATGPSAHKKGDKVDISFYADGNPTLSYTGSQMYVYGYERVETTGPGWNGRPQTLVKHNKINVECWATTDEDPRVKERLKQGWKILKPQTHGGSLTVVAAGSDGYNYTIFRQDPNGYKPHISKNSTRGVGVHLHIGTSTSGHAQMTWEQWDDLVKLIEEERHVVALAPIAAKLEAELQTEEELQAYIAEKGLVTDG